MQMIQSEVFGQDRQERIEYMSAESEAEIMLPLTQDGFNALLEATASIHELPVDNLSREVLAKYLNHLSNQQETTTIKELSDRLYRAFSHALTWKIDMEVKIENQAQARKEAEEMMAKEQALANQNAENVVELPKH